MITEKEIRVKLEKLRVKWQSAQSSSEEDDIWHQICLLCWILGDVKPKIDDGGGA